MFREIILPIFRSTRLCVTICGIMHRQCCRPVAGNIELTGIINKLILLHLVSCRYYLHQWCTVKQIWDNEIYLLIKYIYIKRSLESSETLVLYRGRTLPKGKAQREKLQCILLSITSQTTLHSVSVISVTHRYAHTNKHSTLLAISCCCLATSLYLVCGPSWVQLYKNKNINRNCIVQQESPHYYINSTLNICVCTTCTGEMNCKGPEGIINSCTTDTKCTKFIWRVKHAFRTSTAIFLEGCKTSSVLAVCVTVNVVTHYEVAPTVWFIGRWN